MFEIFVKPFRPTSAACLGRADNGDCLRSQEAPTERNKITLPEDCFGQTFEKVFRHIVGGQETRLLRQREQVRRHVRNKAKGIDIERLSRQLDNDALSF